MERLEKVEKLRQRANVSYEEAKEALDACNDDLLDAMVYLEKQGKTKGPEQSTYSTSYEEQEQFTSVEETVKSQGKSKKIFDTIRKGIRAFIDKCRGNFFYIKKGDEVKFKIPVILFILLMLGFWKILIPLLIVMLFFGCRYSFGGKDDMKEANDIMNKASDLAEQVKKEFKE